MCQRATGSISIAFKNVKQADVEWEHEPDWYDSSPIAERPYCRECGTSLGFRFKDGSENMDLTVASFDDPSRFTPQASFRRREHAPRLAQHRRAAGNADRRVSAAGRQMGRGDRAVPRMSEPQVHFWTASDGVELAYHELGRAGR